MQRIVVQHQRRALPRRMFTRAITNNDVTFSSIRVSTHRRCCNILLSNRSNPLRRFSIGNDSSRTNERFTYINSYRWISKYTGDKVAEQQEKGTEEKRNNTKEINSGTTAPINQRATVAILSQLSSPPNILTLSRIIATPYLSYILISHQQHKSAAASAAVGDATTDAISATAEYIVDATTNVATADTISTIGTNIDYTSTPVLALSLFLVMGFTDFLDGYIARAFPSTATVLGTYLDPTADKFFISVMSVTLWYIGTLPGMLVGLWVARDTAIVGSVYWLVRTETLRRQNNKREADSDNESGSIAVMDPQNTPLKVKASLLSKVNTTLQIGLIALGIAGEVPAFDIPPELMTSLIYLTAGTTIGSSLGYLDGSALKQSGNKQTL